MSVLERITALPLTQVADDECEGHMKGRQRCIACHKMVAAGMRAQGRESAVLPAAPDAAPITERAQPHAQPKGHRTGEGGVEWGMFRGCSAPLCNGGSHQPRAAAMPGAPPRIPPPPRAAAPRTARTPRLCPCTALSGACAAPPGRPTAPPRAAGSSVPVHRAMHASRRIARAPGGFARAPPARTPRGSAARAALSAPRTARTPRSSAPLTPRTARDAPQPSPPRTSRRNSPAQSSCRRSAPRPRRSAAGRG